MLSMKHNSRLVASLLAIATSISLAACGGGGHSNAPVLPPPQTPASTYNGPLADATFTITIPVPATSSSTKRRPAYVSSSTSKIVFTLNSTTNPNITSAQVTAFNSSQLGSKPVTLNSAQCPGTGPWTCTIPIKLPPGGDNLTVSAQDASSNILSQQVKTLTVVAGAANSFSMTLDANAATMTITATDGFCAGTVAVTASQTLGTVGTAPITFAATYTDPAGKTIVAPGLPLLTVNGHTDDNGGAGYTDGTTHLNVKVTQSAQTFTLTQTAGTGNAAVSVAATPPASDNLSFNKTLSFTLSSGPAIPSSFVAAIEHTGSATGKIDFFTLTLGASSDTFSAYSTPTLSDQSNDVDFPQDLLFDGNGDLLIANGGAGNPDFGNFACVPAGAISTGANVATVLTTNVDDPAFIALGSDGSVGLGNSVANSTYDFEEFILSGTYVAAATTRDIARSGAVATQGVVALPATPANPSGSYAVAITDGTQANSKVVIKHPDGTSVTITDAHMYDPFIAYDPSNSQLVVANDGRGSTSGNFQLSNVQFYTVGTTPVKVKEIVLDDDGTGNAAAAPYIVSASSTGLVAVGIISEDNNAEVVLYNGTSSRGEIAAPIPYDATTTNDFSYSTFVIGNSGNTVTAVTGLRWLTGTKLMVSLEAEISNSPVSGWNGLHTYDTTQTQANSGYEPVYQNAEGASAKQTGFQSLSSLPSAVAYKP
ncbi:MAG TPA: hypothetical protein VGD55_04945 [Acidothermaceae bacterium]